MGIPAQIYYHQNGHGGPPPMKMMTRWFTRYLFEVENGVEKDDGAWIVRENDKQRDPTPYADYPNPAAVPVTLHLTPGGNSLGGLTISGSVKEKETLVDDVGLSGKDLATAEN